MLHHRPKDEGAIGLAGNDRRGWNFVFRIPEPCHLFPCEIVGLLYSPGRDVHAHRVISGSTKLVQHCASGAPDFENRTLHNLSLEQAQYMGAFEATLQFMIDVVITVEIPLVCGAAVTREIMTGFTRFGARNRIQNQSDIEPASRYGDGNAPPRISTVFHSAGGQIEIQSDGTPIRLRGTAPQFSSRKVSLETEDEGLQLSASRIANFYGQPATLDAISGAGRQHEVFRSGNVREEDYLPAGEYGQRRA